MKQHFLYTRIQGRILTTDYREESFGPTGSLLRCRVSVNPIGSSVTLWATGTVPYTADSEVLLPWAEAQAAAFERALESIVNDVIRGNSPEWSWLITRWHAEPDTGYDPDDTPLPEETAAPQPAVLTETFTGLFSGIFEPLDHVVGTQCCECGYFDIDHARLYNPSSNPVITAFNRAHQIHPGAVVSVTKIGPEITEIKLDTTEVKPPVQPDWDEAAEDRGDRPKIIWEKIGDHPDDQRRYENAIDGNGGSWTEPNVVKPFVHEELFKRVSTCPKCNKPLEDHGWLNQKGEKLLICPGQEIDDHNGISFIRGLKRRTNTFVLNTDK